MITKKQVIFLASVVVALCAIITVSFIKRESVKDSFMEQRQTLKEAEWKYVWGKIQGYRQQAKQSARALANEIKTQILEAYEHNRRNLEADLKNLDQPNHPIVNIFSKVIPGRYLNGFQSDSDDPFVATRKGIASDFSIDCSAEGRTRSFDKEISLHFAKDLAAAAIKKILAEDGGLIGWQFTQPAKPDWTVKSFDETELHRLFLRFGLDGLSSLEFLEPAYINERDDLLGQPLVDARGIRYDNDQLIVVQGFNIKKQLEHSLEGGATLTFFSERIEKVKNDLDFLTGLFNAAIIFTFALMALVYFVGMSQIERAEGGSGRSTETDK